MLTRDEMLRVLRDIRFNDWSFDLGEDAGQPCLRIRFTGSCNTTGVVQEWEGRKWPLSPCVSRSEIVQTAFKAVITALEHEAREMFKYKGDAIFGPHFDCDLLVELCQRPDALAARPEAMRARGAGIAQPDQPFARVDRAQPQVLDQQRGSWARVRPRPRAG